MSKKTMRVNFTLDDESYGKLQSIKQALPNFNLSRRIRHAIMDYEPLDAFNAMMPEGYKVIRVEPTRRQTRSPITRVIRGRFNPILDTGLVENKEQ